MKLCKKNPEAIKKWMPKNAIDVYFISFLENVKTQFCHVLFPSYVEVRFLLKIIFIMIYIALLICMFTIQRQKNEQNLL